MKINGQIKCTAIDVGRSGCSAAVYYVSCMRSFFVSRELWTVLTVRRHIALLQAVASKLHGQDVEVNIIKHKGDDCDHVQFEINERVKSIAVSEPEKDQINFDQLMSFENKISPFTFCKAFPFHMVFDKNMILRQVGRQLRCLCGLYII